MWTLIGETKLPGFARIRLRQFARALPKAQICDWRDVPPPSTAILTAGLYHPTRTALLFARDCPLWLDLPGDPFADAQAAAEDHPNAGGEALSLFGPALVRGDHFSTIGMPARYALAGQLGLLGRLSTLPPGVDPISVVELAWDFPQPPSPSQSAQAGPLKISISGSFNTWFDAVTLAEGLLLAADRQALDVQVLGGPVIGHTERSFSWFQTRISQSRHAGMFRFLPVVSDEMLGEVMKDREVGICLDKPGFEPVFGSRTRILFWRYLGLKVIATATTAFCRELAEQGQIFPVPAGSPPALAEQLLSIRDFPCPNPAWLAARFDTNLVTRPLQTWQPARLPAPASEAMIELLRENSLLKQEIAQIRGSRTWRILNQLHRRLKPGPQ